ncbi:MAG TPA: NusG domain II-containing protein [bacterium]|nr:NusG domain II-containing protein [bacterium]
MSNMDRRGFLKIASLIGAGAAVSTFSIRTPVAATERQFFLITDQPHKDAARLKQAAGIASADELSMNTTPIQPANQDLSIMWNSKLRDPLKDAAIPKSVRNFTRQLRSRPYKGHLLVTLERRQRKPDNTVEFEVDGQLMEQVNLDRDYNEIVIPGVQGNTTFRIRDGEVVVTESSCRHSLCEKVGTLHTGRIICAPNKLVATVHSTHQHLDSITG